MCALNCLLGYGYVIVDYVVFLSPRYPYVSTFDLYICVRVSEKIEFAAVFEPSAAWQNTMMNFYVCLVRLHGAE